MSINKVLIVTLGLSVMTFERANAQHEWTALNGPFWADGIDCAISQSEGGQEWHRYLIGSDGSVSKPFYWGESDGQWMNADNPPPAGGDKLISYKITGYDQIGFCSAYGDDIYRSLDGGHNWEQMLFDGANDHFACIEVPNTSQGVGNIVMVATEAQQGLISTYYSHIDGNQLVWDPIGESSSEGLYVYDIEAYPEPSGPDESPHMSIGTRNGIYNKRTTNWGDSWQPVAFPGSEVPVLESIDGWDDGKQIAAVLQSGVWSLYLTKFAWEQPPDELRPGGVVFDKEVRDLAAIYWYGPEAPISCYAATAQGIFLIDIDAEPTPVCIAYDLINPPYPIYQPLRYDYDFKSLDYFFKSGDPNDSAFIIATTPYNVYEIIETRDSNHNIVDIEISEIVTGTYYSDVSSVSFPMKSTTEIGRFTVSENGIIKKKPKGEDWRLIGLAFESVAPGITGTDIATDFSGQDKYILASSKVGMTGTIMRSSDAGVYWTERNPQNDPRINSVDLDPVSDDAFAAGEGISNVWFSDNNGFDWLGNGSFNQPTFTDIYSDPDPNRDDFVYAGGYSLTSVAAYIFDGSNWQSMTSGLPGTSRVNQFAKGGNINSLYTATDAGVFKASLDAYPITWSPRTYGIGTPNLGSIVVDKDNPYGLLTSTAPGVIPPHIWASGDSGRSWIELPLGDIPDDASINRLAASQDEYSGFLVGTDLGVFELGNIFRAGQINTHEEWGPGVVIVNGDITIEYGGEVRIHAPCTIYSVYDLDIISGNPAEIDPNKTQISVLLGGLLTSVSNGSDRILFTSSRPSSKLPGDWTGIVAGLNHNIDLQYCDLEFADKGVHGANDGYPFDFDVFNCTFKKMQTAGVELFSASTQNNVTIRESIFEDCGTYGIRIYHDHLAAAMSMEISGNEIIDCDYGIWYSGGSNFAGSKKLNLIDNILTQTTAYTGNYGIYAIKYQGAEYEPVLDIIDDSISYFCDGGIYLNSISTWSAILDNRVKRNKNYGIYLANSSPKIGSSAENYNSFSISKTGIYCDLNSHPKVRWTQIKENTMYGVLTDSDYPSDFGTEFEWGNNSIDLILHPWAGYKDMKNTKILVEVSAERNWWGEPRPDPEEIEGLIDYLPALASDPLPFSPKRSVDVTDLPLKFALEQNSPNPFNPTTEISFYVAHTGYASLKVYNLQGQLVKTLIAGQIESGDHLVIWDATSSSCEEVASGIYFYVLSTDFGKTSKRMTLLR
jgi:photosystem II stability/assembly factor-like uncharacterized protein